MRGECKVPGGKLVGVTVTVDPVTGSVAACRMDGDFFVEGDDAAAGALIGDIERALMDGSSVRPVIDRYARAGVRLVGVDAAAIETAFRRARGGEISAVGRHLTELPARGNQDDNRVSRGWNVTESSVKKDRDPSESDAASASKREMRGDHGGHGDVSCGLDGAWADEAERWRARWATLRPAVVHDVPRDPAEQMAVDEQWARDVAAGERPATLRFWEWSAPAVVIGRFQSLPDEVHEDVAAREGFTVVRRCTGGGAMFIEPGNTITYSLYMPLAFVRGITVEESYRLCDCWLIDALRDIGVDARFAGLNDIASSHGKIGGAAQRRFSGRAGQPGSVLHHVTMAYDIDAEKMAHVLNTSAEKLSDKAVRSARRRVDPLRSQTGLSRDDLMRYLIDYAARYAIRYVRPCV
ncbi:lipoate--protein ligase family protein [Bifidobacterium ramosum]|nr:lipoate--protein ligase family protein [Bifidobacterium ramosum]